MEARYRLLVYPYVPI